jgi:hypothetical protein
MYYVRCLACHFRLVIVRYSPNNTGGNLLGRGVKDSVFFRNMSKLNPSWGVPLEKTFNYMQNFIGDTV